MKNIKYFASFLSIAIFFISCNEYSVKGKWSASDKLAAYEAAKKLDWTGMEIVQSKFMDCYVSKLEQNYSSLSDADEDLAGCKKIATECSYEIINNTSFKGNWRESDKTEFLLEMEKVSQLKYFGNKKQQMIDVLLKKIEDNYSSFSEAKSDEEGMKTLTSECFLEFLKNNSIKGKWCDADKQTYYEELNKIDLSYFGENKDIFLETYLSLLEKNYYSIADANNDPKGTEKLAKKCKDVLLY